MECLKQLDHLKMSDFISLINGEFSNHVSVIDRGLSYGDGLFETMSWSYLKDKKILGVEFWERHLERIKEGCSITKIKLPPTEILKNYKEKILRECLRKGINNGVLKILITRGVGGRGYKFEKDISPTIIFLSFPSRKIDKDILNTGVKLRFCEFPMFENSMLAGLKHLNRIDSVMARSEWEDDEFFDGVMIDNSENIIDGTMTNLFFSKNRVLYTPLIKKSGIKGIMRQVVIDNAKSFYNDICEIEIKKNTISRFDEMFVTNSVIKILPVTHLGNKEFETTDATKELVDYFSDKSNRYKNLELV